MSPWLIIGIVAVGLLVIFAALGVSADAESQSQEIERKAKESDAKKS